ncbi:hypothetical protein SAMN04489729_3851 [Amycolatopsis lurida]|uniref:ESX-1 secretion-associated protein n=1 Tax=Amycolatopsis lurida NRRL 2430 TaxID=1460371 RepID=A0A2P2G2U3_AMYLU|nr:hypothetical protein [Amycolatopsis lurida]KFU83300.1 hypothetical protein BB31_02030 [Amycolatopsis lurida NRRL 2430]SED26175.1 hypothetical protein SAMN04489729_3851 [Amycolatopsis lurida]
MTLSDPLGSNGSGYEVYPEALRKATEEIYHAGGILRDFADHDLSDLSLGSHDVGMLGDRVGIARSFAKMITEMQDKSKRNFDRLLALGEAMDKAADYYDAQDDEYFKRLRDLEKGGK